MHFSLSVLLFFAILGWLPLVEPQDFTCSPTKLCAIGCCNKNNVCGLGPESCAPENCLSDCDRKSECDPGWGARWSTSTSCPLNVCCSKFGFCGTTPEFCGSKLIRSPSCSGTSSSQRTVGYYEGWALGRKCDVMFPEQISTTAYTHLNFAFALIDPVSFAVAPMSPRDNELYRRLTALKDSNPKLQVWISIGGWSMNDPDQPTRETFSKLAASTTNQQKFFRSLISFMTTYGFDGVDIDWEYPVASERSGQPSDKANYVKLLHNMRNAFQSAGHNYGLTITIPTSFWYLQHFDVVAIEKEIDWFNLMSYDLHGTWDSTNVYLGPKVSAHTNLTEIDDALKLLWRNNIKPDKVVLGLAFYGRSFTLSKSSCSTPGCIFSAGGPAGPCTDSEGTLSFAEIKRLIASGAAPALDRAAGVKTLVYGGNKWVSYDDTQTLKMKVDYANRNCLGGIMIWAVSLDGQDGSAAASLSVSTGQIVKNLHNNIVIIDQTSSCLWTECGASCPAGMSPAQLSSGGNAFSDRMCPEDKVRFFCCPNNNIPTCKWEVGGFLGEVFGFCNGYCSEGWIQVGTSAAQYCNTGHHALCCQQTLSTLTIGKCQWEGAQPFCSSIGGVAFCTGGREILTSSATGDGGEEPCRWGLKSLCCDQPPPYQNCGWEKYGGKSIFFPGWCDGTCPVGKQIVSVDNTPPSWCFVGSQAYCCDPPGYIPPVRDPLVTSFEQLLNAFNANPSCGSTGSSTEEEDNEDSGAVFKRATAVSSKTVTDRMTILALVPVANVLQSQLIDVWERIMGPKGLHLSLFRQWRLFNPKSDPHDVFEELICLGGAASQFVARSARARTDLCVVNGDGRLTATAKREFVLSDNEDVATVPTTARILRAIADNRLRFEYYLFFSQDHGNELGLEVVYLLGPSPGQLDPTLQANAATDHFVIIHYHIAVNVTGDFAIESFNIRHATRLSNENRPPSPGSRRALRQTPQGARVLSCRDASPLEPASSALYWIPSHTEFQIDPPVARYSRLIYDAHLAINEAHPDGLFRANTASTVWQSYDTPGPVRRGRWTQPGWIFNPNQSPSFGATGTRYTPPNDIPPAWL